MGSKTFVNTAAAVAISAIASIFVSIPLHAGQSANARDTLETDSRYRAVLLADLSLTPTADGQRCLSPHDHMVLAVLDGSKLVASRHYCSSYSNGSIHIFRDGLGNRFLALEYSEGRGTNATTERLKIHQIGNGLVDLGDIQIGAGTGPSSRWQYDYRIEPLPEGGLRLDLHLGLDGRPECCVPGEPQKTVYFKPVT